MKMFLKIIGGLLYFLLLLLRPIFMVISMLSSRILSVVGAILIVMGILIFLSEGLADKVTRSGIIMSFVLGSLSMLAGPFIVRLDEWYEELLERIGDYVFNKTKKEEDF